MSLVPEGTPGARPIVVTALQMLRPTQLRPSRTPDLPVMLERSDPPDPELSRTCYREVGAPWSWVDRNGWTLAQWAEWVATDGHELWTCTVGGARTGYFELSPEGDGVVQLAYFGLVPSYVGRGIGGWLLTEALRRAVGAAGDDAGLAAHLHAGRSWRAPQLPCPRHGRVRQLGPAPARGGRRLVTGAAS